MKISHIFYGIIISLIFNFNLAFGQSDIAIIRKRVVDELLSPSVNETFVADLISTQNSDGTWPGIDYIDTSNTGFQHSRHLNNLVRMSHAYVKKGSKLRGKRNLKNAIYRALDYWLANDFICENWWWNEIGTPDNLTSVLLFMDKNLTPGQIEQTSEITGRGHLEARGARPSGDRIKIGGIQAKNALFKRNKDVFDKTIKVIESEIKFSPGVVGMQPDYSFHHRNDRVNNTLSYGLAYADSFAEWAAYVAGTSYKFSDQQINMLVDYYLDGICKMMAFGKFADPGTHNRDITRKKNAGASDTKTPERLLSATDYRKNELEEIVNIRLEKVQPTLSFGKYFWQTEHYSHQRPGYFASVRMFSDRNANMEWPYNGEGLLNHHRGDGTNYLSVTGLEYLNLAPVYDWQKIPGSTVMQKKSLPAENEIQKYGTMDFVGAVTDGLYGAVGFDFASPHDPLKARKSWFFFDDEYVCLGAGIKSSSANHVATTIEQSHLQGDVVIRSNDKIQTAAAGEQQFAHTAWVYHNHTGYVFPGTAGVNLYNQAASGSWFSVSRQSANSKEEVKMDVFKLWIDHGAQLEDAAYQYIVYPGVTADEVENACKNPAVDIVSNTPGIQAVRHKDLGITQAVFYKSGQIQLADGLLLRIDSPGIIMIKQSDLRISQISVSDPSRKLDRLHLSVNRNISGKGDNYTIAWNQDKSVSEVSIDLPEDEYAGSSVTINL